MGYLDENGSEINLTTHQIRVWLSTNAERQGMDSFLLAQWAGRVRINDNKHYDLRTQQERENNHRNILGIDKKPTPLEALKLNIPVSYKDLGIDRVGIADVTEYGMCVHDYAMSPCLKAGECMTCKEHICIKGMPNTLEKMKQLEKMVESQLNKALIDNENNAFGADRWVTHLGWKLAHIKTQITLIESDDTLDGQILWIPPEHDPSPIKRALIHHDSRMDVNKESLINDEFKQILIGPSDAKKNHH